MIRLIAAARTTVVVTAWLLGVPTMLVAIAGSPIPARPPSQAQAQAWLQDPLNPVYKEETARVLAWTVWGLITLAILAVITLQLRAARWTKVISHLPPPAQSLAAAILGTAVVATSTSPLVTPPAVASAPASDVKDIEIQHAALPARGSPRPAPAVLVSATGARKALAATAPPAARHGVLAVPAGERTAPGGSCRVVTGDNLWDIAAQRLGDPHRWPEIYHLNRGHLQANGYALTDPDQIDVGWVLALPVHHFAPPRDPPVTQPPVTPLPSRPNALPATPSTSPPPTASPSNRNDSGDGVYAPQPPNSTAPSSALAPPSDTLTPSASASTATGPSSGDQAAPVSLLEGVDVPGGWITVGLGGGLVAAVAMVWRRRRHRYQPTPITSPRLNDADLLPPLAAMTRIRTRLRRVAPETLDEQPTPAPTVREYRAAVVKPVLPPVGPTGSDLAGVARLPLSTCLALTGDGALDAARGLLVATLASGSDDDPDAKGRAIISAGTLATLLGVTAVDLGHLDRLRVTASHADAITALEEEIIRRSRLLADAQAADVHTLRDNDGHAEPLPQLLLLAEAPDPAWTDRLVTAVRLGHSVDIGAAIIGDWPTGTTLTVAADGTTGDDDAPRLAVLDTTAAIEILNMLLEAHGASDSPTRPEPPDQHQRPAPAPTRPDVAGGQVTGLDTGRDTGPIDDTPAPSATPPNTVAPAGSRLPVAVRVLGRPAVLDHDGQPSPGIRSKAIELLVYLAVNREGADLSDIMEALFPDATLRRAGERLSTVVADLRKHIRRAAATPTDTDTEQTCKQRLEPIPNTGSRYHLDPGIVRVDWWTVLDHYQAIATASDDDQRRSHLAAAIEVARGGLAEGVEYDWIDTDREAVRRHRIKLHTHTAALLADTDPHRAWLLLEQACQIDPLSEELARTTMRAAAALGDADAIRHRYKALRDAVDAHGLELSDETETLAQELLRRLHPPRPSVSPQR